MRIAIVLAAAAVVGGLSPTQTGEIIGSVTMEADGTLHMLLRSVQCDGMIVEGPQTVRPSDKNYQSIIDHVGGLKPNETKRVRAWPTPPCPSN